MKKLFSAFCLLLCAFLTVGCGRQNDSALSDILNNNATFIDQSGKSVYLKNYRSTNFSEAPVITKYALADLNNDGLQELVAYASQDYGFYIIFYKQKENFHSFEMTEREMVDLKQDGTFIQSESALISKYVQLSFDSDPPTTIEKAYKNDIDNIYRIDNSAVTYDEFSNYENSFKNKPSVTWNDIKSKTSSEPKSETKSTESSVESMVSTKLEFSYKSDEELVSTIFFDTVKYPPKDREFAPAFIIENAFVLPIGGEFAVINILR